MSQVAIIMGSKSDFEIMSEAIEILKSFDINTEYDIVSAHRTPNKMVEYASDAEKKGQMTKQLKRVQKKQVLRRAVEGLFLSNAAPKRGC